MSNSRDLLKEAIADAKSVKEAAIANAKAALEEAFTPYLQEKFAAKLAEMEMEEEEDVTEEMTDKNYGMDDSMEENINLTDFPDEEGEHGNIASKNVMEKDEIDELDLDELLAELDEEERTEGMEEKTEESLTEAEEEEEMKMDSEEEVEGEDEEIDLEDMSEEDLKSLIEDVIADMVAAGELEAGENFEAEEGDEDEEDIDIDMEDEESEEETVDELLKEEEVNEGVTSQVLQFISKNAPEVMNALNKLQAAVPDLTPEAALTTAGALGGLGLATLTVNALTKDNSALEKIAKGATNLLSRVKGSVKMEEMEDQIEELASTLSEVKLLNAKLLYTNKIFRAKNLNETQKVKVLEAFDKAASVKEAKLIYETLTTIKETKSPVTESMRGMASKASGMAPEKKPILEVNDQFARWKVLAGIKNN